MQRQLQYRAHLSRNNHLETNERDEESTLLLSSNEWNDAASSTRTIFSGEPEIHEAFQANGSRTPIGRGDLHLLRPGNHIGWHRPYLIWHHAIVVDVDIQKRKIRVIHFTKVNKRTKVAEQWIDIDRQKGDLFRFNYGDEVESENPPEVVIQRARAKVDEGGYKLFKKNCEHIATECKTGQGNSAQVKWAWGKTKEALHAGAGNVARAGTRLGCAVVREMSKQTGKSIAEGAGKVGGAEIAEHIAKGSNWVGAGIVAGVEVAHGAYDIYHIHKNYKAGKMTKRDFRVTTTQRVSEGVFGGGLAIGASIFGEWIGGLAGAAIGSVVPVVGTAIGAAVGAFVGSVVCGAVGSIVGKALGSIFGRWFGNKLW